MWKCQCDCGNIVSRRGWDLQHNQSNSCGCDNKNIQRIGEERKDKTGTVAKIIGYKNCHNITIEYQDDFKFQQTTTYQNFCNNQFLNPYAATIYNKGIIGAKYPLTINGTNTKEYNTWNNMLIRCFDDDYKKENPAYKYATCSDEWLLYEEFYEWLHKQENFNVWINLRLSAIDKDILVKGNKTYSAKNCCLVPSYVNGLFIKVKDNGLPPGVHYDKSKDRYISACANPFLKKQIKLGQFKNLKKHSLFTKNIKKK